MNKEKRVENENRKVSRGIGFRMILVFVLIIIIPLGVMAFGMLQKSTDVLKQNSEETVAQLMNQSEMSINNYLTKYEVMVKTMGKNSGFQDTNKLSVPGETYIIGFDSEFKSFYARST